MTTPARALWKSESKRIASVACFNAQGQLLFGLRGDAMKWCLPGGHFEPGENAVKAAVREVFEETGLKPKRLEYLGSGAGGKARELAIHCFRAEVGDEAPTTVNDPDQEFIGFRWVDPHDIPKVILDNLYNVRDICLRLLDLQRGPVAEAPLVKGAMRRLAPFNPQSDRDRLSTDDEATTAHWQSPDRDPDSRAAIPDMADNARLRALHRLAAKTSTRLDPETGRRHYLLHRGASPEEIRAASAPENITDPDAVRGQADPGLFYNHSEPTSWTPLYGLARNFAREYGSFGSADAGVLSAWVPEDAIRLVPAQYGRLAQDAYRAEEDEDYRPPKGENEYGGEHEVVVDAHHNSRRATPEEVQALRASLLSTLHGRINDAGVRDQMFQGLPPGPDIAEARVAFTRDRLRERLKQQTAAGVQPPQTNDPLERADVETTTLVKGGYASRLWPFQPRTDLDPKLETAQRNWVEDGLARSRDALARWGSMPASVEARALHRLGRWTQQRRNPQTGEREFLLHRGMSGEEGAASIYHDEFKVKSPGRATSWSANPDVATTFAGTGGLRVSAWIPASAIRWDPNRLQSGYRVEREVIVGPHESELEDVTDNPTLSGQNGANAVEDTSTIHGRINVAAQDLAWADRNPGLMSGLAERWKGRLREARALPQKPQATTIAVPTTKAEALEKAHPTPTFPGLGLPDDRRETPYVSSSRELENKQAILVHTNLRHPENMERIPRAEDRAARGYQQLERILHAPERGTLGMTSGTPGIHAAFARAGQVSLNPPPLVRKRGRGSVDDWYTQENLIAQRTHLATKLHEDFHQMMLRVKEKYGTAAARNLAWNLWHAIPKQYRKVVSNFHTHKTGRFAEENPEEALASIHNYLHDENQRSDFYAHVRDDLLDNERPVPENLHQGIDIDMKRAHRALQGASAIAHEGWLQPDLVKSETEALEKMAIANLRPGGPAQWDDDGDDDSYRKFDYSHLLTPEQRQKGYGLVVREDAPDGDGVFKVRGVVTHPQEENGTYDDGAGFIDAYVDRTRHRPQIEIDHSRLSPRHRGQHLGVALYEAALAHVYHHHGIRLVVGGAHSTAAAGVHGALARRHGLEYEGEPNPEREGEGVGDYDEKFAPYDYALKTELEKMAIADLRPGEAVFGTERPVVATPGREWKTYDYSHLLPPQHRQDYRVRVVDTDYSAKPMSYGPDDDWAPHHLVEAQVLNRKGEVGQARGQVFLGGHVQELEHSLRIGYANLQAPFRGLGLGLPMYEALMAHALHQHQVKTVRGGNHSSSAHRLHEALARKHGLEYRAEDAYPDRKGESMPFDDRYNGYQYALKHEEELLAKGAMRRLYPFNPTAELEAEPHLATDLEDWTQQEDWNAEARERLGRWPMSPAAKARALAKLSGLTSSRRNPNTGEREFLLHRGMGEKEYKIGLGPSGQSFNHPDTHSSWTSSWTTADSFSRDRKGKHIVSAWVPESHIVQVPMQYGDARQLGTPVGDADDGRGSHPLRHEEEVVVSPGHNSAIADADAVKALVMPDLTLHGRINQGGRARPGDPDATEARLFSRRYGEGGATYPRLSVRGLMKLKDRTWRNRDSGVDPKRLCHNCYSWATDQRGGKMELPQAELWRQQAQAQGNCEACGRPLGAEAIGPGIQPPETMDPLERHEAEGELAKAGVSPAHTFYHGTDKDFDTFEQRPGAVGHTLGNSEVQRTGFFFTPSRRFAESFGPKVKQVHLDMRKPFGIQRSPDGGVLSPAQMNELGGEFGPVWRHARNLKQPWQLFDGPEGKVFVDALQARGYDGATFEEEDPEHPNAMSKTHVVFRPEQIRPHVEGSEDINKAVDSRDFRSIVRAESDHGEALVDHRPQLESTAAMPHAQAYSAAVLLNQRVLQPQRHHGLGGGITKKLVYRVKVSPQLQLPGVSERARTENELEPGDYKFMVKPYHERIIRRCQSWMQHPHLGWAEVANQALYHAAGIGHLHQLVHVAEHDFYGKKRAALVIRLEPGMGEVGKLKPRYSRHSPINSSTAENARKIGILDFLSNNLDRHGGNLLINQEGKLLAIDHGRSFQYKVSHSGIPRRGGGNDSPGPYLLQSAVAIIDPLVPHKEDPEKAHYWARQENFLARYKPIIEEWWPQHRDAVVGALEEQLKAIRDPRVGAHIRRNFMARVALLDEMAQNDLDNYGHDSWYKSEVPTYRPGELTDEERVAEEDRQAREKWEREEEPRRRQEDEERKRKAAAAIG